MTMFRPLLCVALMGAAAGLLSACADQQRPMPVAAPGTTSERDRGAPLPSGGTGPVTTGGTTGTTFGRERGGPMTPSAPGTLGTGGTTGDNFGRGRGGPMTPSAPGTATTR
ncbi:MAG TPA: hypothetical protein VIL69_12530 [Roseomonas sp.]|jgi:hypothetical protein